MSERERPSCYNCDEEANWTWHDGMFSGGVFCHNHIREKLDSDANLPEYKDRLTTEQNVTTLRGGRTAVIPAGARPLDGTYPVVRSKEALDEVLEDD